MDGIVENPNRVSEAEILVGIPSLNEAGTISNVAGTADQGLKTYFPGRKGVIVNADNHSPDGTRDAFLRAVTDSPKIYISTPPGVKGKGRNVRNLLQAAVDLKARALVIVDADLTSFTPRWIRNLGEPLFQGFDYVSPVYERHKYDASITNHFACPLLRALYGFRVRQPIGGDFGLSGTLARSLLSEGAWSEHTARFGIDIWMTTLACVRGFRVCETFLGSCKSHRVKNPALQLNLMFQDVVAAIFDLMVEFGDAWKGVRGSSPSSVFGYGLGVRETPPVPEVDVEHLFQSFRAGFESCGDLWRDVIPSPGWEEVLALRHRPRSEFQYPSRLWVRVLYSFAAAYRRGKIPRKELLGCMVPFYHSRMLSYVNRTRGMGTLECEEYLENIFRVYEQEKGYLIERWEKEN